MSTTFQRITEGPLFDAASAVVSAASNYHGVSYELYYQVYVSDVATTSVVVLTDEQLSGAQSAHAIIREANAIGAANDALNLKLWVTVYVSVVSRSDSVSQLDAKGSINDDYIDALGVAANYRSGSSETGDGDAGEGVDNSGTTTISLGVSLSSKRGRPMPLINIERDCAFVPTHAETALAFGSEFTFAGSEDATVLFKNSGGLEVGVGYGHIAASPTIAASKARGAGVLVRSRKTTDWLLFRVRLSGYAAGGLQLVAFLCEPDAATSSASGGDKCHTRVLGRDVAFNGFSEICALTSGRNLGVGFGVMAVNATSESITAEVRATLSIQALHVAAPRMSSAIR